MRYNLFDEIEGNAARRGAGSGSGGDVAVIQDGGLVPYSELMGRAGGLRRFFGGLYPAPRPRVALVGPDSAGYVASALGLIGSDGVFVSAGKEIGRDDFESLLLGMSADVAVLGESHAERLKPADFAEAAAYSAFGETFRVFLRGGASPDFPDEEEFNSLNPAFVRFTSGTTGDSKGVVLSHETIRDRTEAANAAFSLSSGDRVLWLMPMAHHFAATINLFLRVGCALDISNDLPPAEAAAKLRSGGHALVYATPWRYREMAKADSGAADELPPSVRSLVSTAMALSEETAAMFKERFGRYPNQAYGIIECGIPCVNMDPERWGACSVGTPSGGHEISLDDDGGEGHGEILLRGPGFFDAYLRPWRRRDRVLDRDWFRTGDLGEISEDGALTIVGRSKSVINFMGLKVFPEKVEAVLDALPGVRESRVLGEPHRSYGEIPVAEVVPENPGTPPDATDLLRACSERLSSHEVPQDFKIVESIPKTPSGKVSRAL